MAPFERIAAFNALRTDTALRCQDRQRGHGRRLPAPAPDVELHSDLQRGFANARRSTRR